MNETVLDFDDWTNCSVVERPYKANLWLRRDMCFAHSLGIPLGEWEHAINDGKRAECLARYGWREEFPGAGGIRPL